jgi:hypothetical protein
MIGPAPKKPRFDLLQTHSDGVVYDTALRVWKRHGRRCSLRQMR